MKIKLTKICRGCKKIFEKKINCSKKSWEITFFCSRKCVGKNRVYIKPRYKIPLGNIPWNKDKSIRTNTGKTHFKKGQSAWNKDMEMPEEMREKMKVPKPNAPRGEKHARWRGGISSENMRIRNSKECREWAIQVKQRDNYTCQKCGKRGGYLISDHIKPFAFFPDLRFELSNGRTLCKPCDKIYGFKYKCNISFEENLAYYNL